MDSPPPRDKYKSLGFLFFFFSVFNKLPASPCPVPSPTSLNLDDLVVNVPCWSRCFHRLLLLLDALLAVYPAPDGLMVIITPV